MYYIASQLSQPFTFFLLILTLGYLTLWRNRVESRRRLFRIGIPLGLILLVCTPAFGLLLMRLLENQYPPASGRSPTAQAIVVLGGYAHRPDGIRSQTVLGLDSQFRCIHAAEVYAQGKPCPVIVSGGKVRPDDEGPPIADLMHDMLLRLGVAAEDILVENQSRDTSENAAYSAKILKEKNIDDIILVSSATHMPRAVATFEGVGLSVEPSPCHYRSSQYEGSLLDFLPSSRGASATNTACHELLGMLLYWIRGDI